MNYDAWRENPDIRAFMESRDMERPQDLQAYFIKRYYDMVRALGKTAMGWEEILHPNMPEDAVLHIWLSREFPAEAVRHPLLVSQGYYLDLMQTAYAHHQSEPTDITINDLSAAQQNTLEQQFLGGEAASWAEHINRRTVDMRNWPRAAAIGERLWSPREVTDGMPPELLYPRLFAMADRLEAIGLQHRSHVPLAMARLAGPGGNAQALEVLASVTEPASEHNNAEYSMIFAYLTGLTWFVDFPTDSYPVARFLEHIPPESETAWHFNHAIDRLLVGELPDQEVQQLRQQLTLWRDNHAALEATISNSQLLTDDGLALVSASMSELAGFGLEALDALQQDKPLAPAARSRGTAIVDKLDYLDHSTETETEYFASNLFKPRGLRLHVIPIQRGIKKMLMELQ